MSGERVVDSTWHSGWRCEVSMGEFSVSVDEPIKVGGTNQGAQPTDLFLASIASCFTLAVAFSARKRSIELSSLRVRVTGTYDGPRFRSVRIDSDIGCDASEIDALIKAAERVCYVTNTLRSDLKIDVNGQVSP